MADSTSPESKPDETADAASKYDFPIDPDPASTYGRTEGYITAWNDVYGEKAAQKVVEASTAPTGVIENSPTIVAEREAREQAEAEGSVPESDAIEDSASEESAKPDASKDTAQDRSRASTAKNDGASAGSTPTTGGASGSR